LVSDPARPESAGHAALTELASVIRNVTEQLAGFRRRALAAESRLRELEQTATAAAEATRMQASRAAALELAVAEARVQAGRIDALERELAEARVHRTRVAELERALAEAEQAAEAALAKASAEVPASARGGGETNSALQAENAALRERLGEAVERTRVIGERVRFLRQQLGNGVEK
jgi:predicted  nucleic acid-binding Zn-ribbon protein